MQPQSAHKLSELGYELLIEGFMLGGKALNNVTVGKNIDHSIGDYFAAGLLVIELAGFILCQFCLNQVIYIQALIGKSLENKFPEIIIFYRGPLFNEMGKFVCKSSEHCVLAQTVNIGDRIKAAVDIYEDSIICPLKTPLIKCVLTGGIGFGTVQDDVDTGCLCVSGQKPVCSVLTVIECFFQISQLNAITAHSAFSVELFASRFGSGKRRKLLCCTCTGRPASHIPRGLALRCAQALNAGNSIETALRLHTVSDIIGSFKSG